MIWLNIFKNFDVGVNVKTKSLSDLETLDLDVIDINNLGASEKENDYCRGRVSVTF